MADAAPRRGGFGSRGDRGGDRGDRGRGRGRRGRRGGAKSEEKEWQPVTKLGRLVKAGKITSMEQIYLHSLPVKEYQIVDYFLPKLKDEVMKIKPVQNRPAPVSVLVSRPLSSLVTVKAMLVLESRPPRKSLLLFVPPLSSPSSVFFPSVVVIGVPTLVSLTLCLQRRAASVVQSLSDLSPLPVVPVLLPPPLLSVSSNLLVSRMPTHPPPVRPRPSKTHLRLLSLPSETPTVSLLPTCGRRLSSFAARWRSLVMSSARASATRCWVIL